MEEVEPEMEQSEMEQPVVPVVVIKDERSPVKRLEVQPALAALDELSDLELSEALRGYTAKQQANHRQWNSTDVKTYLKERQLIRLVGQQPALYDCRHWQFNDEPHKERVWQSIADQLKLRLCQCMNSWAELRYRYQQHVRSLRIYRRKVQQGQRQLKRPSMLHDEDLLFLFPHVARYPVLREEEEVPEDNDDVTILPPPPPAIIDVDADYAEEQLQQFKLSAEQERLIDAVQPYPQLYDSQHPSYDNHRHRGLIWVAISNELHEQATKLMKIWLQLQTRYEWQLMHGGTHCPALQFLAPHVRQKEQTVCKMSMYLQHAWHDPIDNFRGVMQLINVFKTLPDLAQLVEDYVESQQKPAHYAELWQRVATQMNVSAERCEVTWLVLRSFYLELHEMRKAGYQLQDKWFFEKIITGLYKLLAARSKGRARKRQRLSSNSSATTTVTPPPAKRVAVEISSITTSSSDCSSSKSSGCTSSGAGSSKAPIVLSKASTASRAEEANRASTSSAASHVSVFVAALPSLALPKLLPAPKAAYSTCTLSRLSKPPTLQPMTNVARALQGQGSARGGAEAGVVTGVGVGGEAVGVAGGTAEVAAAAEGRVTGEGAKAEVRVGAGAGVVTGVGVGGEAVGVAGGTAEGRVTGEEAKAEVRVGAGAGAVDGVERRGQVPGIKAAMGAGGSAEGTGERVVGEAGGGAVVKAGGAAVVGARAGAVGGVRVVKVTAVTGTGVGTGVGAVAVVNGMLPTLKPAPAAAAASSKPKTTPAVPQLLPLIKLLPISQLMPKPPPEIKVEFLKDGAKGRQLRISGGSLQQPSVLEMPHVILFVREVLAIPQLHSKEVSLQAKIEELWQQISKKYNISENVCRALFTYLAGNLSVLPQISSVTELMCPLRSNLKVWETSQRLFSKFNESARKYDWVKPQLPQLLQHFQRYEHLYWKLRRPQPDEPAGPLQPPREYTKEEREEVWHVAQERFPHINHQDIWYLFKCTFRTYMEDLERGVENPWPQHWWHALQQLKFLIDVRYHRLDPYYYIVHNKFVAQVRRCSMYERLMQSEKATVQIERSVLLTPWELEEERQIKKEKEQGEKAADKQREQEMQKEKEQAREKEQAKEKEQVKEQALAKEKELAKEQEQAKVKEQAKKKEQAKEKEQAKAKEQAKEKGELKEEEDQANRVQPHRQTVKILLKKHQEDVKQDERKKKEQKAQKEAEEVDKEEEEQEKKIAHGEQKEKPVQQAKEKEQTESVLICTLQEAADELESLAHLEPLMEPLQETASKPDFNLPTLEPYQVTRILRCHPASYGKADTLTKRQAWVQVAKELNATVTECRFSLQHAVREQRLLQMTDPKGHCKLTKNYYHHMSKIYEHVKEGGALKEGGSNAAEIRLQLQQEATASAVIPENFIPDINFSTCSTRLVLKNWAYAACKVPMDLQRQHLRPRLKEIFARYEKLAKKDESELSSEAEAPK